jgi:hypothetical protein
MWGPDAAGTAHFPANVLGRCTAIVAAGAVLAACGGSSGPPGPYQVVNNYLNQIAEGNYSGACALIDSGVREALIKKMGSRISCPGLFVRCLPSQATNLNRDQSQLLYATILVTTHRRKSEVALSGTAVTKALRSVTLAKERRTWKLTSYGRSLQLCPKEHPLHASRRSPRA